MEELFKALSEKVRLRMMALLLEHEMCVCEIACVLKLTQSKASRHLSELRQSGILESYKSAQWTYYRASEQFKTKHTLLWEYLNTELKKPDIYPEDQAAYERCKIKNICDCGFKPH